MMPAVTRSVRSAKSRTQHIESDSNDATVKKKRKVEEKRQENVSIKKGHGKAVAAEKATTSTSAASAKSDNKSKKNKNMATPAKVCKYVGAHTSITGGLYNAVLETVDMGGRAFAMFLKSQRQWNCKPLAEKDAIKFKDTLKDYDISPRMVLPHGSYLMNCGSPDNETLDKSRAMLLDEVQRCEQLGLTMFNFHPGSSCGKISIEESVKRIADSINMVHSKTEGSKVITVLENMSCQGNTLGGRFEELRDIIAKVKDKSRVGVCLDTCHTFAAGLDLRSTTAYEKTMKHFGDTVGFKYLKAAHINDSKGDLGCHSDRHENIGRGKLGMEAFRHLMNDSRFDNIPLILETPGGYYDREIRALYKLCGSK